MTREECGQMAHQTLPNILLSNGYEVTKSCIARFVDDNAFNPSALSDCSTGPSPPLAHGKSTLSPSHPNAGCPQPDLFGRFRSISEQTAHRSGKIRPQCERPPIHVLNPRTAGGGGYPPPPSGFSQIAKKRRRVATPNLPKLFSQQFDTFPKKR